MTRSSILRAVSEYEAYRRKTLNLIPSENLLSDDVLEALSSSMAGRYAGKPESYGGSAPFHRIWEECERLAKAVFRCQATSVTPISGHVAGMMTIRALTKRGDKIATIPAEFGGYKGYTHGFLPDILGLKVLELPFDQETMNVNPDAATSLIEREKPSLTILGATVFLFPHPVTALAETAHSFGGRVFYDGSHVLGLIAGRAFQDPLAEGADVVAGSTHKTLFGPQGGIIFTNDSELVRSIEDDYVYRFMDNFQLNRVAALGVALEEVRRHARTYSRRVIENAKALAERLDELHLPIAGREGDFTLSHQVLLQAGGRGTETRDKLEGAGIIVDSRVRFGTNEVTRRGMAGGEMVEIAELSDRALRRDNILQVRRRVKAIASEFSKVRYTLNS